MPRFTWQALLLLLLSFSTTGCMLTAYDGYRVADRTSSINFFGYELSGAQTITIEAYNFSTNTWDAVASTTSAATTTLNYPGTDQKLYPWSVSRVLPLQYWAAGPTGHYARTRAKLGTFNLTIVRGDWGTCLSEAANVTEFANKCASHRSEAHVYTEAYQHGCAAAPAVTKSRYSVHELPACQRTAIRNLQLEYINRPVIDGHYAIVHHDPTSFFYDHRRYLQGMERYLMVYGDKFAPSGRMPFWDPGTTIPSEWSAIKVPPAGQNCLSTSPGCTGWFYQAFTTLSPNRPRPAGLAPGAVCSYTSLSALHSAVNGWHGSVHGAVGGTMGNFDSPAAPIFWSWHTYVDQILRDWEACP